MCNTQNLTTKWYLVFVIYFYSHIHSERHVCTVTACNKFGLMGFRTHIHSHIQSNNTCTHTLRRALSRPLLKTHAHIHNRHTRARAYTHTTPNALYRCVFHFNSDQFELILLKKLTCNEVMQSWSINFPYNLWLICDESGDRHRELQFYIWSEQNTISQ